MVSREDLESFLDRLGAEGATAVEVEPNLWRVRPGGALDYDLVATYTPPVVLLRAKVMDRPADPDADAALARACSSSTPATCCHGAYGFARDAWCSPTPSSWRTSTTRSSAPASRA
jgi:hypothetical protein